MTNGKNVIQSMIMKVSKGLEFPVVTLPGVGYMPAAGEDEQEAATFNVLILLKNNWSLTPIVSTPIVSPIVF